MIYAVVIMLACLYVGIQCWRASRQAQRAAAQNWPSLIDEVAGLIRRRKPPPMEYQG